MTLHARLLLLLVSLLAVGIIVCDVAAVTALRSYLLAQVDDRLQTLPATASVPMLDDEFGVPGNRRVDPQHSPLTSGDYFVEVRDANGELVAQVTPLFGLQELPSPSLDSQLVRSRVGEAPFTVGARDSASFAYRVVVRARSDKPGYIAIAAPLSNVNSTVRRLMWIETTVTLLVLFALGAMAWYMIRRDLRPLDQMTATASAIADGDLSRRVEEGDANTEVGRLGIALNTMLSQIEGSFQARKQSEERLRRFAADASHELRTPITAIRGYAEMYRMGAISDEESLSRAMNRIEAESTRMGGLVEDLLLLARLDQGRPLQSEIFDLSKVVSDAVVDARVVDSQREWNLDATSLEVKGDRLRIQQVVANLLSNASTHTPEGTPVEVTVHAVDGMAVVSVKDHGPGLEQADADSVFERFYRVDTGRARDTGGAGLGLSIVRSLVTAHGGSVNVYSSPGEGATFVVRLPLVADEPASSPA